ncbi:MAG: hypothetical protein ACI4J1_08390 [Ruminiclostridium sp.]
MRCPRRKNKFPIILALFGGAILCLCFISFKIFLIILAIALIALGIWLLKCC